MPGLPLPGRETTNVGCACSHSRAADQMCRQQSRVCLTAEEQLAAEESFSSYCKPVELYNILQRRAIKNPYFLQRCLLYKILAKQKKRILIAVSLSASANTELQARNIFPLYVLLARPSANVLLEEHSPIYRLSRACLVNFSEFGNKDQTEARFTLPDVKKLATDPRASNLEIILISCGEAEEALGENLQSENHVELSSLQKFEGKCFWGKIPIELLASSLENCVTLSLGHAVELVSTVTMNPSFLEPKSLEQNGSLTFCSHKIDSVGSYQLQISICAQEAGAMEMSPYDRYLYSDVPASSLPQIIRKKSYSSRSENTRSPQLEFYTKVICPKCGCPDSDENSIMASLRSGNVLFNYKYCNNTMQRTEVTEDFACPFCLVQCASYKGLRCHLTSSHDLFNFEFWVTEEYQAVNVSVKTDSWRTEVVADGVDPRLQTFSYRSKLKKRRRSRTRNRRISHVHPHIMEPESPEEAQEGSEEDYVQRENGISVAQASLDPAHSLHGSNLSPPAVLQFGKTRKLSAERADPRNRALLQKRQFFHSHRAQPMALEQVFSDRDSEDEVDDDIADLEDRRMLDDFVDVTKDEKLIMHMWNSFVRKQRVLADGHIPWACEAFSRLHGQELVHTPALLWCWRFFMIKLWNHSLLDARTMNNCNVILESYQNERSDPKQS